MMARKVTKWVNVYKTKENNIAIGETFDNESVAASKSFDLGSALKYISTIPITYDE